MDLSGPADFLSYVVQYHIARKGFASGTFHEAEELVAASDAVLTLADGLNVSILCIVDATRDPAKTFALPPERVSQIAAQCRVHTGTMGPARGVVTVNVIEIGGAVSAERRERLSAYKRSSVFARVYVAAYAIDEESRSVWTNSPVRGGWLRRSFQGLLDKPRLPPEDLAPKEAAFAQPRFPYATALVAAFLVGVFALQIALDIGPGEGRFPPSLKTLVGFGGLIRDGVEKGDWFRFFMAPILHGGVLHLAFNLLALYLAGRIFEGLVGWAWFGAVFVLGALGGGAASLMWNADNVVSVGASGAISGLLAAGYVCSFRLPIGPQRTRIQGSLLLILIPGLIPALSAPTGDRIDIAAHMGGAVVGGLMGWAIRANWPDALPVPRYEKVAAGIAMAGMVALVLSGFATRASYAQQALSLQLVPQDALPKTDEAMIEQADTLLERYPRDPRLHFARGLKAMNDGDAILAERSFRAALAEEDILRFYITPDFGILIRSGLALTLAAQGKPEARDVATPLCGTAQAHTLQVLRRNNLCP
jgi:rhomboid protease GluP